jgi:hypothetical protein
MAGKSLVVFAICTALTAVLLSAYSGAARGETIAVDDQLSVIQSDIARPARGMTMRKVEEKFGTPAERHDAVGTPAITRWDYQNFSVFFENDRVIHAVVTVQ